jgi:hypothetical protein
MPPPANGFELPPGFVIPMLATGLILLALTMGVRGHSIGAAARSIWPKLRTALSEWPLSSRKDLIDFILLIALVGGAVRGLDWLIQRYEFVERMWIMVCIMVLCYLAVVLGLLPVYFVPYTLYKIINTRHRDKKSLMDATRDFVPDRQVIAQHFQSFHTGKFRDRYVTWLEEQEVNNAARLRFRAAENMWPSGKRPNVANDNASARLAQLDARWLGIE